MRATAMQQGAAATICAACLFSAFEVLLLAAVRSDPARSRRSLALARAIWSKYNSKQTRKRACCGSFLIALLQDRGASNAQFFCFCIEQGTGHRSRASRVDLWL